MSFLIVWLGWGLERLWDKCQKTPDSASSIQLAPSSLTVMLRLWTLCSSVPLLLKTYDRLDWLIQGFDICRWVNKTQLTYVASVVTGGVLWFKPPPDSCQWIFNGCTDETYVIGDWIWIFNRLIDCKYCIISIYIAQELIVLYELYIHQMHD